MFTNMLLLANKYLYKTYKSKIYNYNPHTHVKIWLSSDRDIYLNTENQLRLIRMRVKNPNDIIHFIYDSQLLSELSIQSLKEFCEKHNLIDHDANKDIFHGCKTDEEKTLFKMYKNEISHLNSGGNLAAASDILRILNAVYSLGTYSDFDLIVDTNGLPEIIQVNEPLLIAYHNNTLCNDLIAVVDHIEALNAIICLQRTMIANYHSFYFCYEHIIIKLSNIVEYLLNQNALDNNTPFVCKKSLSKKIFLRNVIDQIHSSFFIRQSPVEIRKVVLSLQNEMLQDISLAANKQELKKIFKKYKDQEQKTFEVKTYTTQIIDEIIKLSVMDSTGPNIYFIAFIAYFHKNLIKSICSPNKIFGSFNNYKLFTNFKSQVSFDSNNTTANDLSWLTKGKKRMKLADLKFEKNAKIIQKFLQHKSYEI